ncbi:HNH endonuclease [Polynucleobacter corsicus]|uniref:HNH endonuclease n=1 Tax=Polynucleobacter corsicus TaxID=2081042 RepID=UPI001BFD8D58|nr:HNH endonuclease [Polynucleobacter corsicus]QWE18318.1 HNH endonuclease [Polynucleobacter corsicus]
MTGRIKKKLILFGLSNAPDQPSELLICPLCDRAVPKSQRDEHHLVPKSHGGRQTAVLHRICHRQIHAVLTETELARQYNTVEQLRLQADLAGFIEWVRSKPDDFFERTRKSRRLKSA